MYTLALAWMVVLVLLCTVAHIIDVKLAKAKLAKAKISQGKHKKIWIFYLLSLLCILMLISFSPPIQSYEVKKDSILIETFDDGSNLYYDTKREEYFSIERSYWNPLKIVERRVVDEEAALQMSHKN